MDALRSLKIKKPLYIFVCRRRTSPSSPNSIADNGSTKVYTVITSLRKGKNKDTCKILNTFPTDKLGSVAIICSLITRPHQLFLFSNTLQSCQIRDEGLHVIKLSLVCTKQSDVQVVTDSGVCAVLFRRRPLSCICKGYARNITIYCVMTRSAQLPSKSSVDNERCLPTVLPWPIKISWILSMPHSLKAACI